MDFVKTEYSEKAFHLYHSAKNELEKRPLAEAEEAKEAARYFDIAGLSGDQLKEATTRAQIISSAYTVTLRKITAQYHEQWVDLCNKRNAMIHDPHAAFKCE